MKNWRMRTKMVLFMVLMAFCVIFPSVLHADYVINIDFNGAGLVYGPNPTYEGVGFAGGGTYWNGMLVDSSGGDTDLTVVGSNLSDSEGTATGAGFTIIHVAGELGVSNNMAQPTGTSTQPYALMDTLHCGYNGQTEALFTFSGLGALATSADVYFYADTNVTGMFVGTVGDPNLTTLVGTFTGAIGPPPNIYKATGDVTAGQLTGAFSTAAIGPNSNVSSVGMIIAVTEIPEPATVTLLVLGGLGCLIRRKK